uniref:Vesicle-associated membrane protein n=1 Tax=Solanum tuberosum TaxID=4113 RepID=M1CG72_SOLTU
MAGVAMVKRRVTRLREGGGWKGLLGHGAWSLISRLTDEKASALQQNQKLRQELELVRKEINKSNAGGVSMLFVVLIGLIGLLVGYLIKKT